MSTKIYDGLLLRSGTDVFEFTQSLRASLNQVLDVEESDELLGAAVEAYDRALAGINPPTDRTPLAVGYQALLETVGKLDGDEPFSMCFGRDPQSGATLAVAFTTWPKLHDLVLTRPEVEEYGYWDNTDHPDGVTDEEWVERRDRWSRVIGSGVPATSMLTFQLRGRFDRGVRARIVVDGDEPPEGSRVPSTAFRAHALAVEMATRFCTHAFTPGELSRFLSLRGTVREVANTSGLTGMVAAALPDVTVGHLRAHSPQPLSALTDLAATAAEVAAEATNRVFGTDAA